jgi:CSLREA domain-containing protein
MKARMLAVLSIGVVLAGLFVPQAAHATALRIVVTSALDVSDPDPGDGVCRSSAHGSVCTLRAAIQTANANAGVKDEIRFSIATGPKTIMLGTPPQNNGDLPAITDPLLVRADTQPGSVGGTSCSHELGHPCITLEASGSATNNGLRVSGAVATITGFAIHGFFQGVRVDGASDGTRIVGNYLGTNADGTPSGGNLTGVDVESNGVTVGGVLADERNLISGNGSRGVLVGSNLVTATGTTIVGNRIGTTADGSAALSNGVGIFILNGSHTTIGGTVDGAGNLISGNTFEGIHIGEGAPAPPPSATVIQGNLIGTDASGSADLGNGTGIRLDIAKRTLVGGSADGAGNVISGNGEGIHISGSKRTRILGNRIGTGPLGTALSLGNDTQAISVLESGKVTIGGGGLAANEISNNGKGITVTGASARVRVSQNSIHDNGGLGIDLTDDGVTANDPDDADTGPNGLQNFPVLGSATSDGEHTVVHGHLSSKPGTTYLLRFWSNGACDPEGHGEAEIPLGTKSVTTDAGGTVTFSRTLPGLPAGTPITATATDPKGNSSELSHCREVTSA